MSRKTARDAAVRLLYARMLGGNAEKPMQEETLGVKISGADWEFVQSALEGIAAHEEELNALVSQYLRGWTLERVARVDLCILQNAFFEILYREDIPASVSINEAVELAKNYGGPDSSSFINGILSQYMKDHP